MKIIHISFSSSGGAGRFAQNLSKQLVVKGLDSSCQFFNSGGLRRTPFRNPLITAAALMDQGIVMKSKSNPLFSYFRNRIDLFDSNQYLPNDTVLHLHWTPGAISTESVISLASKFKVIWTLHDMFPFTGGCHHAVKCKAFEESCNNCPQVHSKFQQKVLQNHMKLQRLYSEIPKISFVSPSHWLKQNANMSSLLSGRQIHVIENPIDLNIFKPRSEYRELPSLRIGFCASDLSNPNKNILSALKIVNEVALENPSKFFLVETLGVNSPDIMFASNVSHKKTEGLSNDSAIAAWYRDLDLFINPSLNENYPTTVLESQASAIPTIALDVGGTSEIILESKTGVTLKSIDELKSSLIKLLSFNRRLEMFSSGLETLTRFNSWENAAESYTQLYGK